MHPERMPGRAGHSAGEDQSVETKLESSFYMVSGFFAYHDTVFIYKGIQCGKTVCVHVGVNASKSVQKKIARKVSPLHFGGKA
jgi:hypothetical protein